MPGGNCSTPLPVQDHLEENHPRSHPEDNHLGNLDQVDGLLNDVKQDKRGTDGTLLHNDSAGSKGCATSPKHSSPTTLTTIAGQAEPGHTRQHLQRKRLSEQPSQTHEETPQQPMQPHLKPGTDSNVNATTGIGTTRIQGPEPQGNLKEEPELQASITNKAALAANPSASNPPAKPLPYPHDTDHVLGKATVATNTLPQKSDSPASSVTTTNLISPTLSTPNMKPQYSTSPGETPWASPATRGSPGGL